MKPSPPPVSELELLERAERLAGRTLAWVAGQVDAPVPEDLRRNKGWIGQVVEAALGATAGNRAEPDFPHLHVELKTLPVTTDGRCRESTYVCTAPLMGSIEPDWERSWVRRKLSRVLWLPIVGAEAPGTRVVGSPLLWSPSDEEEGLLRADWEELTALIAAGELWQIDARRGRALQIRPKAASRDELVWTLDDDGHWVRENPRGFYLRPTFTAGLLRRHFLLGS